MKKHVGKILAPKSTISIIKDKFIQAILQENKSLLRVGLQRNIPIHPNNLPAIILPIIILNGAPIKPLNLINAKPNIMCSQPKLPNQETIGSFDQNVKLHHLAFVEMFVVVPEGF